MSYGDSWSEPAKCGKCGQERSTHDDAFCEGVLRSASVPAQTRQDVMTRGVIALIANGNKDAARFAIVAPSFIRGKEPSMVVGKPGASTEGLEDHGCTVIIPLPVDCPKLYACQNETGGATIMLSEEY